MSADDKELVVKFDQTIRAHNESVIREYREALKMQMSEDDSDLALDFDNANAA